MLWTDAIRRAVDAPEGTVPGPDWVAHVAAGLDLLDADRRPVWTARLADVRSTPPERFTPNGYVVTALQAALACLAHTPVPADRPCRHLRVAVERAVRIGDDTDTVAAVCGALAGAWWGATAVPLEWRRVLHGRADYDSPPLRAVDLDRLARLAHAGGRDDPIGWPSVDRLVPYYEAHFPARPLAVPLDGSVTVGNVHALASQLDAADEVVSLCRMGRHDVPDGVGHQVVGLLDTTAGDNPNLAFVLADTADHLADRVAAGRSVFLHCVQAQHRTPAVAAAYLMRAGGLGADEAVDRAAALTGTRPRPFLVDALRTLAS